MLKTFVALSYENLINADTHTELCLYMYPVDMQTDMSTTVLYLKGSNQILDWAYWTAIFAHPEISYNFYKTFFFPANQELGKVAQNLLKDAYTLFNLDEPGHEKYLLCHMRTTKAQISLRIRAV